jgi:hypothetical protein
MSVQDPIVGWLAQKVRQLGESRPLTWRACHAIRDMLGADGASITIENSSMARVTLCASERDGRMAGEPARCAPGRAVPGRV